LRSDLRQSKTEHRSKIVDYYFSKCVSAQSSVCLNTRLKRVHVRSKGYEAVVD